MGTDKDVNSYTFTFKAEDVSGGIIDEIVNPEKHIKCLQQELSDTQFELEEAKKQKEYIEAELIMERSKSKSIILDEWTKQKDEVCAKNKILNERLEQYKKTIKTLVELLGDKYDC